MDTSIYFASVLKEVEQDEGYRKTYKNFDELRPTLLSMKGWWYDRLLHYQGFWLSDFAVGGSMLVNDHFKPRSTDIVVATSPKCGTTWLRALVFSIVNRKSFDFTDHPLRKTNPQELVQFLEGVIYKGGSTSFVEGLPSPRLLSTHLPYSMFPKHVTDETSGCRLVYICRDPKDVFVSKWHFANKLRAPKELPRLTLEEAFDMFCKGVSHYGPFWDHVLGYWKASLESPKKVLFLKYEDVKKETPDCVRRVAEFLGVPFSLEEENKEIVGEIVKLCSFENMSNQDVNKNENRDRYPISNSDFFRKGEVGDWVNHLSPQMVETIDQITEEKLRDILWTTSARIITRVIGSGVLSLAWAIAQLGWIAGPAVMLLFSFITYYTFVLLADCYRTGDPISCKRNYTYIDVVRSILDALLFFF